MPTCTRPRYLGTLFSTDYKSQKHSTTPSNINALLIWAGFAQDSCILPLDIQTTTQTSNVAYRVCFGGCCQRPILYIKYII